MSLSGSNTNIKSDIKFSSHGMKENKKMERQLHVLMDLENLSHIHSPLRSTHRIRYTCFCVSKKYMIFGATSGGLYIFKREPCTFLQLIPSKDGILTGVSVSPSEKLVAYATSRGLIVLIELQSSQQLQQQSRRLQVSQEHIDADITALQWGSSSELYVGDSLGRVSLCTVSLFLAKNIFHTPSLQLMHLDSAVVQLAYYRHILLISTLTRCYISDTRKEQYKQVGLKMRDGRYGACFLAQNDVVEEEQHNNQQSLSRFDLLATHENLLPHMEVDSVRVFCARPGSRLWEVRHDGTVLSTHQFRQVLVNTPPSFLVTANKRKESKSPSTVKHSFNFTKLYPILNKFIFTFNANGLYIIDPDNAEVVVWTNELDDIFDAQIFNDTIYVWLISGPMHAITLSTVEKCIMRLYFKKQYALCAQLCSSHLSQLLKNISSTKKLHFLVDLGEKLMNLGLVDLQQQILPFVEEIAKIAPPKLVPHKLKSGIYVVGNNHSIERDESEGSLDLRIFRSLTGSPVRKLTERSRSLTSSPEIRRRRKSGSKQQTLERHTSLHSLSDPQLSPLRKSDAQSGHTSDNYDDWEARYAIYSDMFYIPDAPFAVMTSPDTIAALKDLTQNLSVKITKGTKTLKKKWHALEDKVRALSLDPPLAPLDVRSDDYQPEDVPPEQHEFEVSLPNCVSLQAKKTKEKPLIELDVTGVIELSSQIQSKSVYDGQLYDELFISVCSLCDLYMKQKHEHNYWLLKTVNESFPFHIYFEADVIKIIEECFRSQLKTQNILKFLEEWIEKLEYDWRDTLEYDSDLPDLFKNLYTSHELKLDVLMSRIISVWSTILDAEQILEALIALTLPCYFMSWCAVLNHFQQDVITFITSESREGIRGSITDAHYPLPKLLNVMYLILRVSSVEGIDICLAIGEKVKLRDFCYIVLKLHQQKKEENSNKYIQRYCQNIFLSYLVKLIQSGKDIWCECFNDKEVFEFTLSSFLEINAIKNGLCKCGFPQPQSVRYSDLQFQALGTVILQYFLQTDPEFYVLLCSQLGLWRDLLRFKQHQGTDALILPYVIQIDCPLLLNELNMNEMLWRELLQTKRTLETTSQCLNCGSPLGHCEWRLTWTHLGCALIRALGADTACDLMMQYMPSDKPGALTTEFYQSVIFSKMVSSCEDSRLSVVNINPANSRHLFSSDTAGLIMEALERDLSLQGQIPLELSAPADTLEHHWGVQVGLRDAQCPRCTLQLSDPVLLGNGGVRIFPCSHAFHATCVRKLSNCVICISPKP